MILTGPEIGGLAFYTFLTLTDFVPVLNEVPSDCAIQSLDNRTSAFSGPFVMIVATSTPNSTDILVFAGLSGRSDCRGLM